jgi:hypothetical protein
MATDLGKELVESVRKAVNMALPDFQKGLAPLKNKFLVQKKGYKQITKPGYTP